MGVYLKNQNRLIMSSISIADKKAAILIRINTAIISALIVFESYMYKVFNKIIKKKYPNLEENNFMIFEVPEFEKYELSMQKVLKSQNLQIGNLTRFNYFMSKSIARNYKRQKIWLCYVQNREV